MESRFERKTMTTWFAKEKEPLSIVMSRALAEESMPLAFKTFKT
jgi:hypothetical protein